MSDGWKTGTVLAVTATEASMLLLLPPVSASIDGSSSAAADGVAKKGAEMRARGGEKAEALFSR